jgi:hypothetical protein
VRIATPTVVLLAAVLLSVGLAACSDTSGSSSSSASAGVATTGSSGATSPGYLKNDADKDSDDEPHTGKKPDDDDDETLLGQYGPPAGPAAVRAVASVVKRYYAAAAAENGAEACDLLYGSLAEGLGSGDTSQAGKRRDRGCVVAVDRLFKEEHRQLLADEVATMVVPSVRLSGGIGIAVLGFKAVPERAILIESEAGTWKVGALFDSAIP